MLNKTERVMPAIAKPEIRAFFDEPSNTVSYLVWDAATMQGAVIDPVLDFDQRSGQATVTSADSLLAAAEQLGVKIGQVLETHAHADHLSGAPYIKLKTGATVAIGEHIRDVQRIFRPMFNAMDVSGDGSEFDHLFKDGERFRIGNLTGEVIYTPGHTPACVSYKIGDAVFVGDTLFMPDYGTAPPIFPAAMRVRSTARSSASWRCRARPGYSCATTTRRPAATNMPGKPRSAKSARAMCTCTTASARTRSLPCAPRATPSWRRRSCCPRSRSISAPANFRRPRPTACAI
jgi:glyoxylase-like metal-dependent hydrolase (beta-lactamase superfamily II)